MKTNIVLSFVLLIAMAPIAFASPYKGSSVNEVLTVIRDQAIPAVLSGKAKSEIEVYRKGQLPQYIPFATETIVNDAVRTLNDRQDYYPRLEKRIHGNGICFSGFWQIDPAVNPYTGYFSPGTGGLFIGRASTTTDGTRAGSPRTFGFAGKIFPTFDKNQVVKTENFFTVDVLLGQRIDRFSQVKLSNKPPVFGGIRNTDWKFVLKALQVNKWFKRADSSPNERPVANLARLGLQPNEKLNAPAVMEISVSPETPTLAKSDFRDELNLKNSSRGLILIIKAGADNKHLQPIGRIFLDESFVSYGCDRQLHFAHPKME